MTLSPIGELYQDSEVCILFGNNQMGPIHYKNDIKELCGGNTEFALVNQIHGDGIAYVSKNYLMPEEADGMICSNKNQALIVKTADCLPIAIHYKEEGLSKIAMVHAGWRGVYNDICLKALDQLKIEDKQCVQLWVGPHIQARSFQVQEDVLDLFDKKFSLNKLTHYQADLNLPGHYFLNLSKILEQQLTRWGIDKKNIYISSIDTFHSSQFHSFRRDKSASGRNLNMICLL